MKYYAQFYQKGVMSGNTIEACGDRSVIILDGRMSRQSMGEIAAKECAKRGFIAWRVFKGDRFDSANPVSQLWYVNVSEPVRNPAWLSAHN
jgi:hypothetical protein